MKIFPYFSPEMLSNSYLIGPDKGGEAILIDPGQLDTNLLMMIEDNNFYIKGVLITRFSPAHTHGLRTLLRVYDAQVYAHRNAVYEGSYYPVKDQEVLPFNNFNVQCQFIPEHYSDSVMYHLNDWVFTGDVLSAGNFGHTENLFKNSNLKLALTQGLFKMEPKTQLFPGFGPPTTVEGETKWNLASHSS
ncbi:MBL fold metallo-hydrolase [Spirochaeta cellobiosiphila]|uniref:MBL fold metallo-hydrolase n=1 Tax=Spirochaeta cellobiosiphila TaxID=504483 RepID=UPI0003F4DC67|nr:MBL fold metallo-hydrolase [Spirochaeta cellobiosiphila]